MDDALRLGLPHSQCFVELSRPERPHSDELTFFGVTLTGDGLEARTSVESIGGDELGGFLRLLGEAPRAWDGEKHWQSLARELTIAATCDVHGHVALAVSIAPRPWEPTWSATARVEYALGELLAVASDVDAWFG